MKQSIRVVLCLVAVLATALCVFPYIQPASGASQAVLQFNDDASAIGAPSAPPSPIPAPVSEIPVGVHGRGNLEEEVPRGNPADSFSTPSPLEFSLERYRPLASHMKFTLVPHADLWSDMYISTNGSNNAPILGKNGTWNGTAIIRPQRNERTSLLVDVIPRAHKSYGRKHLGKFEFVFLYCDFFTVSFSVWMLDCLPRLVLGYAHAKNAAKLQGLNFSIPCPGEFFASQYLTEVFHIPESELLILPGHIMWQLKYPELHVGAQLLYYGDMPAAVPHINHTVNDHDVTVVSALRDAFTRWGTAEHRSNTTITLLFMERLDMTAPYNYTKFLTDLQALLPHIQVTTVRPETLRVVDQIALIRGVQIMVAGCCGSQLTNMLHLPKGSLVVELFGGTNYFPEVERDGSFKRPQYLFHDFTGRHSTYAQLAQILGHSYEYVDATRAVRDKLQSVFNVADVAAVVAAHFPPPANIVPEGRSAVFRTPVLLGCQHLFHLSKQNIFMGWFKQTYVIPGRFALKLPRTGEWRRVMKEMVILRNFSADPYVTPALALCFDNPKPMYAQSLFVAQLGSPGSLKSFRMDDETNFVAAVGGYLHFWKEHLDRGRFLFYCDAGPKNWAIGFNGRLQTYDFDTAQLIPTDVLCSEDEDCGCGTSYPASCQNHRCTYAGMFQKTTRLVNGWLTYTVKEMMPGTLRFNNTPSRKLLQAVNNKSLTCEHVVGYLRVMRYPFLDELRPCGDTPLTLPDLPPELLPKHNRKRRRRA